MSDQTNSPNSDATKEYPVIETVTETVTETESAPSLDADPPVVPTPVRRGPSVPTIVWGLLFALIAAVVMIGQTSEVDLNLEVSVPVTLLVAGVVLVVWGVAGLGRSRRTP
jgi:hypothetical protein